MDSLPGMRQLEERGVDAEITLMVWSPKMDIVAVANINGVVTLYRLNWQKVIPKLTLKFVETFYFLSFCFFQIWTIIPPESDDAENPVTLCTQLVWRFDGKLLGLGYANGSLHLLDMNAMETSAPPPPLFTAELEDEIVALTWLQCEKDDQEDKAQKEKRQNKLKYGIPVFQDILGTHSIYISFFLQQCSSRLAPQAK